MSDFSQRRVRLHALAAATAVALSSFVAAPALAGHADLSGLQSSDKHDRFIVKYRAGSAERLDVAKARSGVSRAAGGNSASSTTCAAWRWAPMWSSPTASSTASRPRR